MGMRQDTLPRNAQHDTVGPDTTYILTGIEIGQLGTNSLHKKFGTCTLIWDHHNNYMNLKIIGRV